MTPKTPSRIHAGFAGCLLFLAATAPVDAGTPASQLALNVDRAQFDVTTTVLGLSNYDLVDIEILHDGTEERYSAVYMPLDGTLHTLIQQPSSTWEAWLDDMALLDGRYLDFEVDYYNGAKRYSGIFLEDGSESMAFIKSTNSDSQFQDHIRSQLDAGRQIVDFESYQDGAGNVRYAGIWASGAQQPVTHLYYGLSRTELEDLLDPPLGRVLDIEQYRGHADELRYAVILAQVPGDRPVVRFANSSSFINSTHSSVADADTHLVDLDFFESAGTFYNAVWGSDPKGLAEMPQMPAEVDPQPRATALDTLIDQFESLGGESGEIGLYAKNLRTGQSVSYRADNLSYIASTAKIAVHVKYLQEVQAGRLDSNQLVPYTNGSDERAEWYVDERDHFSGPFGDSPGFGSSAGDAPNDDDLGQSFALERYDRAMMQVSDNAATSALVDHPDFGVAFDDVNLNEWLASLHDVGPEFGLVTSIQDVDRFALWQGQQDPALSFLDDPSYLGVPAWASSPTFRTGVDTFGDLNALFTLGIPGYDTSTAVERYERMGLNQSSPRALGNLVAKLWRGELLNPQFTALAAAVMTRAGDGVVNDSTLLNNHPDFPTDVVVRTKGGSRFTSRSEAGWFELGPDAISIVVLTEKNTRKRNCEAGANNDVACDFLPGFGNELLKALTADLEAVEGSLSYDGVTSAGNAFDASCDVINLGGGDASPFPVAFYASEDAAIGTNDLLIGSVMMELEGGETGTASWAGSFPASISAGAYRVGCIADPAGDGWGAVGEIDESLAGNGSDAAPGSLLVGSSSSLIFYDGFETGDATEWASTTP